MKSVPYPLRIPVSLKNAVERFEQGRRNQHQSIRCDRRGRKGGGTRNGPFLSGPQSTGRLQSIRSDLEEARRRSAPGRG